MTAPRRYELTDAEWDQIRKYFPKREAGQKGRPRNDDRQMLNGILWIARSGASWRDLPERYSAWNTVYSRFVKWQREGLFQRILNDLGLDADLQDMSLDSTCVKAHQHSAGAKKGL
jgi:transposase